MYELKYLKNLKDERLINIPENSILFYLAKNTLSQYGNIIDDIVYNPGVPGMVAGYESLPSLMVVLSNTDSVIDLWLNHAVIHDYSHHATHYLERGNLSSPDFVEWVFTTYII